MAGPRIAPSLAGYIPPGPGSGPQVVPRRGILDELENLSYGIGQGQVAQLEGLKALFTQPAQTITGLYRAATNPRATIAAMAADTMQKARGGPIGVGQLVGEMLSPRSLLGVNAATQALRKPGLLEIDVYHGSPHEFDAFDSSKIGTGEGAQAYGHGLYFAESPETAKEYRDKLSTKVTVDGSQLQTIPSDSPVAAAHNMVVTNIQRGMPAEEAIAATNKYWIDAANEMLGFAESNPQLVEKIRKEAASRMNIANAAIALKPESFYRDPGALYTVDLPDEMVERMLDWDKPFSRQPKAVQEFFRTLIKERQAVEAQTSGPEWGDLAAAREYDPTGGELLRLMGNTGRMDASAVLTGGTGGAKLAAELRGAGIPGIRYLDAGSRGQGGSGTRNFVVFPGEEKRLRILKRE